MTKSFPLLTGIVMAAGVAASAQAAISIDSKHTQNMTCVSGTCKATAQKAILNIKDLTKMLSDGDVTVITAGGAIDIQIEAPFSWTSSHRLTLQADHSLRVESAVSVIGKGSVTIRVNRMKTTGDLHFENGGTLTFWDLGSRLSVNGNTYRLIGDINALIDSIAAGPSGFYALANDFVAGSYEKPPISTGFTGSLEGLGHTISNLSVTAKDAGLFMDIGKGATVRDFALRQVSITPKRRWGSLGALAATNEGSVFGVTVTGTVGNGDNEHESAGGLVGINEYGATIRDSVAAVDVTVGYNSAAGGLAYSNRGSILHSVATGSVQDAGIYTHLCGRASAYAGGLVAYNDNGATIFQSHATGIVTQGNGDDPDGCSGYESYAGGLVGIAQGSIDQSYSTGDVTAGERLSIAGGLIGKTEGASVTNSYAVGSVTRADDDLGGLIGDLYSPGTLQSSYSLGQVYLQSGDEYNCGTGGLIGCDGADAGAVASAYWDLDTSGVTDPNQGCGYPRACLDVTGLTDAQLKSGLPAGFDPNIWGQSPNINSGYPYLLANPPTK